MDALLVALMVALGTHSRDEPATLATILRATRIG